jgi:hypothetical protein
VWFSEQQSFDVVTGDFEARGLLERNGARLMLRLIQHGGEAEEFAVGRLVDDHFLMILIDSGDANFAGDGNVSRAARSANFVNALAGSEATYVHLAGEDGCLIVVEERE